MKKLLAIAAVLPYIFTHVLANRDQLIRHGVSLTPDRQSAVGIANWVSVLSTSLHYRFFTQLLGDLESRNWCTYMAESETAEQRLANGAERAGDTCPVMISTSGQTVRQIGHHKMLSTCAGFCFPVIGTYNYTASTEDNYCRAKNVLGYAEPQYNKFWTIPVVKDLDYEYHARYSSFRSTWQKYWIEKVLDRAPALNGESSPWIIFTSGAMGVGKGYVMKWMSNEGYFGLEDVVHVDPDFFKSVMPEKDGYVTKSSAADAATNCHRESGTMMELAVRQAMLTGKHIWEDGSLRDADWYGKRFEDIRNVKQGGPKYRIAIVHIVPESQDQLLAQVKERAKIEGRGLDEWRVLASWTDSTNAVDRLKGQTDFFVRVQNTPGKEPQIIELSQNGRMKQADDMWKIFKDTLGADALQGTLLRERTSVKTGAGRKYQSLKNRGQFSRACELVKKMPLPRTPEEFKDLVAQTKSDLAGWDGAVLRLWDEVQNSKGDSWKRCLETADFLVSIPSYAEIVSPTELHNDMLSSSKQKASQRMLIEGRVKITYEKNGWLYVERTASPESHEGPEANYEVSGWISPSTEMLVIK